MRRIVFVLVGVALLASASWYCSSDAPSPTPPKVNTPGPSGSSALQIRLFTSNANPIAGSCTAIQALVTFNGANVPDGTGVSFTTDLAGSAFQQNLLPLISVVTQGGVATTALCSTSTGLATVRATATVNSITNSATIQIAFQTSPQVAPFFTFCTPSFGPATGGTTLIINGGRFFGDASTTRATFTALGVTREALVTAVTDTTVTLVTPAFPEASSSSVPVTINVTFGTKSTSPVTLTLPNCFAYGTASSGTPTITAVVPSSGSNEGNTLVSIFGSGFTAPLQVFFGPVEARVVSVSFNQIVVSTPPASGAGLPNLNATVSVRVHEVNSGLDATLAGAFRFVTALQITAMDNGFQRVDAPFTPVTIHGQGFLAPVAVTLAGVPAKVISVSATELLVLPGTPFLSSCSDLSGPVVVTNIDSGDTKSGPTFTYQVAITKPTITSVSPASGPPGTSVTITGTNLGNITSVTVGGKPAPIVSTPTATSVVVTIPDNFATAPACPAGTATGTLVNVGSPVDVTVTSSLTTCTVSAGATFQYQLPCVTSGPTPTPTVGPGTPTVTPGVTADLVLSKNASPSPVVSGSTLTYTLGVTNNKPGSGTATGVTVTDPLPVGTTFQSCTTSQGSCTGPSVGSNGTVIASLGSLPSPGFGLVTIVVNVTAPGGSTLINTAVVNSTTPDTDISNNTASVTTTVSAAPSGADLSVVKTSSANTVPSGGVLAYTVTVHNGGPDAATGVIVNDTLPSGTTFVSCTTSQGTCSGPPVGSNGTVTANLGTMASGSTVGITIVVNVTASSGSTLVNTAVASSAVTDPNPGNNSGTNTTLVGPPATPGTADLGISKVSSPNPVFSGSNLTYSLEVVDLGPSPSNSVVVNDTLPVGTTFVSCATSQGVCTFAGGTVTANLGTVATGASANITIVVNVTAPGGTTITNTGSVTASTPDPNPANNTSQTITTIVNGSVPTPTPTNTPTPTPSPTPAPGGVADLSFSKTGTPGTVVSGGTLTYQLKVTNNGPDTASAVVVTDPLPVGTVFGSCSTSQGGCVGPAVGSNGTVTVSFGQMASGANALATIVVTVTAAPGASFTNLASVTTSTFDPNPGNNTASAFTSVTTPSADLSITKTAFPNEVFTGKPLTYTITVTNNGPDTANTVEVSDPLPPGTTFTSCATTVGACGPVPAVGDNGTVRVELGNMPAATSATITIVVTVTAPGGTTVTDTATVTSNTTDPNLSNNSSSVTTTVNP